MTQTSWEQQLSFPSGLASAYSEVVSCQGPGLLARPPAASPPYGTQNHWRSVSWWWRMAVFFFFMATASVHSLQAGGGRNTAWGKGYDWVERKVQTGRKRRWGASGSSLLSFLRPKLFCHQPCLPLRSFFLESTTENMQELLFGRQEAFILLTNRTATRIQHQYLRKILPKWNSCTGRLQFAVHWWRGNKAENWIYRVASCTSTNENANSCILNPSVAVNSLGNRACRKPQRSRPKWWDGQFVLQAIVFKSLLLWCRTLAMLMTVASSHWARINIYI